MTREQIAAYRGQYYVAANTIVVVAGNVTWQKSVSLAKKYFAQIKISDSARKEKVFERQTVPGIMMETRKTDQTNIALGVRAFNVFHPDRYALELLATVLGGMMSSRLFVEVREKLGIAYDIKTEFTADADSGYLVTVAGLDTSKAQIGIETILREYKKIADAPLPAGELKKAKDNFIGHMVLQMESSNQLASFYAIQDLIEGGILKPEQVFKKINQVTASDIQNIARQIFVPERLNLAVISSLSDKEKLGSLLHF